MICCKWYIDKLLSLSYKMTNKVKMCRIIYYSIFPWLLYMFQAILLLIIRNILTVLTVSGFIHMYCCRLLSWLSRKHECQAVISYCHFSSENYENWIKCKLLISDLPFVRRHTPQTPECNQWPENFVLSAEFTYDIPGQIFMNRTKIYIYIYIYTNPCEQFN
jgi:hypothetical protein